MIYELRYGTTGSIRVDGLADRSWAIANLPNGESLIDPQAATRAALRKPLGFPPLRKAVVPGDHVAIALGPGLPQSDAVVAGVIHELIEGTVEADDIAIVCTPDEPDPRKRLPAMLRGRVQLQRHDPADSHQLEFLTSNRKGRPVYLNRTLCDADQLITVERAFSTSNNTARARFAGFYPNFSDVDTLRRFRNPALVDPHSPLQQRAQHEVERIGWLSGAPFAVQVIPAGGEDLMDIVAGEPEAVGLEAVRRYSAAWQFNPVGRANLIVVGISGGEAQQTWENIARSLETAAHLVEDGGAVVLCTDAVAPPDRGVSRLRPNMRLDRFVSWLDHQRPPDTLTAVAVAEALRQTQIYLLSRLDADLVETLGFVPLSSPDEVVRLMHRHDSSFLVPHGQFVAVSAATEGI